jgi:N-acetylneuraminic acid mutarotase
MQCRGTRANDNQTTLPIHAVQTAMRSVTRPALLILLACLCPSVDAQTNAWAWIGGSNTLGTNGGQSGIYGTLGTPAVGNTPGARNGAANWTDSSGNFWLFGGYGYDANDALGYLNDLWEFNPSLDQWVWMSGSNKVGSHGGQPGVYGTLATPNAANTPGSRNSAATWTDKDGNLWLFGGWAYDFESIAGELNDLWEFNPITNQWAWMGGSSAVGPRDGQSGVYGTLGTPAAGNTPGGLYASSSWTDSSGNLWLFAGQGYDGNNNFHELNGLWEFNPTAAEWTWMDGSKTVDIGGDVPGVYGTLATPAAGNIPGNRSAASSWTSGSPWLFGGNGYDASGNGGYLNDLWQFDPISNEWAWMSGSSSVGANGGQSGVYGTLGKPAAANTPGGRSDATSWTGANGNLWLFAGYGSDASGNGGYLNDLWEFNPTSNNWAWMNGSSTVGNNGGQPGVYGTLDTPDPGNVPGGRDAAGSWTDSRGNLWLFGGYGFDAGGNLGYLNDLWKFQLSTTSLPTAATPTFSPASGTYTSSQSVTISDATADATIYYTADGTTPTSASPIYSEPITIASTETLKAIATANGNYRSAVATASYIISLPASVATPTFSPAAGAYTSTQSVTILDATPGATIYYTTNGSTPTTASAVYAGAINISTTETFEAIAAASGHTTSPVATAAYVIDLPTASFTIAGTAITIAPGAVSGNASTITVSPSGGFKGAVAITVSITTSPASAQNTPTLSFGATSPVTISGLSGATATLTVNTTAPSSAALLNAGRPANHKAIFTGTALACLLLFSVPAQRRSRTIFAIVALFAILTSGVVACGATVNRVVVITNPGTTPGTYTLAITGTSGGISQTRTIILTVQ